MPYQNDNKTFQNILNINVHTCDYTLQTVRSASSVFLWENQLKIEFPIFDLLYFQLLEDEKQPLL